MKVFSPENEEKKTLVLLYLYNQKPCGWIFQVQEFGCCIKIKKSKYLILHCDISIKVHRSICDLFYNGRGGQQPVLYDWRVIRRYRLIYVSLKILLEPELALAVMHYCYTGVDYCTF